MKVIAVAQQKGGVSKSTLAIHIAAEAVSRGHKAVILELDKQGTASFWSERRDPADAKDTKAEKAKRPPEVIRTDSNTASKLLAALSGLGVDVAVLDMPGAHNVGVGSAVKIADFVVIPTRPQEADIAPSAETLSVVHRLRKPYAYVLTFVEGRGGGDRAEEARDLLRTEGHKVAPQTMGRRQIYADAISEGRTVFEVEPKGKAAEEIRELCRWINEQIDGGTHAEASNNRTEVGDQRTTETRH